MANADVRSRTTDDRPDLDGAATPTRSHPATDPDPSTLAVLVVDDTPVIGDVMAQMFSALGHRPTVVASGPAAIELLRSPAAPRFDVIFSDISMPGMSGHELAREIRSLRARGEVQTRMLVAMSGYGDPEERERSLANGFDRHVVKPADFETLEALLAEVAGSR